MNSRIQAKVRFAKALERALGGPDAVVAAHAAGTSATEEGAADEPSPEVVVTVQRWQRAAKAAGPDFRMWAEPRRAEQHQSLKAMAALQGKTIKQYALDRFFPTSEDSAMQDLRALLDQRPVQCREGTVDKAFTEIAEDQIQAGGKV